MAVVAAHKAAALEKHYKNVKKEKAIMDGALLRQLVLRLQALLKTK